MQERSTAKRCPKCRITFENPAAGFHKNAAQRDGWSPYCKTCKRATNKPPTPEQVEAGQARSRERMRRLRAEQPESVKAAKARYYSRHNDRLKARQRAYHAAHPEVGVAYIRNIKVADPEKLRVYWRRKRARKLNVSGAHTAEDVYRIYAEQQGRCFWCKEEVGSIYHVDHHMPLSRGGTDDATNLVIACPSCNLRRGNHLPGEWAPEPKTPAR